ncbi:MAG: Hpt domain-containing protein, partial [Nitrospira sp.]
MSDEMQEILNDFLTESNEMLEVLDQRFVTLESDPNNTDLLNEIFRAMHSMKGSAGFLGFTQLVNVAHRGENILNKLRQGEMAVSPTIISVILETIDVIKAIMGDIRATGTDSNVATDAIAATLDAIITGQTRAAVPAAAAPAAPNIDPASVADTAAPAPAPAPSAQPVPTLGEILVNEGLASKDQVLDALNAQQHQPDPKTP